jgi:two-component system, NarL family, nitrate/nitrite response regulator NarL
VNTVLVCDQEPIAMEGLRSLLESTEGLRVVAAENSLEDGMDAARQLQPTVMFVDKAFGIDAVMDWLRALRAARSPIAAIVWSVSLPEAEGLRFLQSGAAGVIRKTSPLAELMTCIRTVAAGGVWFLQNATYTSPPAQTAPSRTDVDTAS